MHSYRMQLHGWVSHPRKIMLIQTKWLVGRESAGLNLRQINWAMSVMNTGKKGARPGIECFYRSACLFYFGNWFQSIPNICTDVLLGSFKYVGLYTCVLKIAWLQSVWTLALGELNTGHDKNMVNSAVNCSTSNGVPYISSKVVPQLKSFSKVPGTGCLGLSWRTLLQTIATELCPRRGPSRPGPVPSWYGS